jgi:hypothetical protein
MKNHSLTELFEKAVLRHQRNTQLKIYTIDYDFGQVP